MRTVIYVRLSVHRGAEDPSTSPEGQEAAGRAYCAAQGWTVHSVVTDLDVTGGAKGLRLDRPGIQELRDVGAERVVFLKIDRIARNTKDFLTLAEEFTLVSVKEGLDMGTAMGRFVATILAAFAEMELEMISGRVKDARAILDAAGRFAGGVVPYGYHVVDNPSGNGKVLAPHPEESAMWQDVAEGIIAGRSLHIQTKYLNHKGVEPRGKSDYLSPTTVRETLVGESIVGRKNGVQVYEPAIDLATWAQLRSIFEARKLPQGRRRGKNVTLLTHVMTCSGCGSPLWAKNDRGTLYARCSLNNNGGDCPSPASVKYENLEALVLDRIEAVAKERPVVVLVRPGSDPLAVRSAEDRLEAAQAHLRAAVTAVQEEDALAERREARAAIAALLDTAGEPVLRMTGERVWDVLMGEDRDAAAQTMQQVLKRVVVAPGGRGVKVLDPERVTLEWADYVEPDPKPRKITRGGKILNQVELDRWARENPETEK